MTKAVNIDGLDVLIKNDEYGKFCQKMKEFNVPFEEVDDWSVKCSEVFSNKNI